ncbi:hypothetical protein HMPREF9470_01919 [[Clostridium] citroniae WAL-19142]|nr:hypothetical protein HMPREF9470_01919 [[Clostridium] citroniae WAL-19142]
MVPAILIMDFHVTLDRIINPLNLCNLLFLGLGASALCFVTWNLAVKLLGSVRTSVYIYMVPVITTVSSAIILKEPVTITAVCGILLTLAGLFLSERRS